MPARFDAILPAPFGRVGVRADAAGIREIAYLPPDTPVKASADALVCRLAAQLEAYYADPDAPFDLPLALAGTGFRQRVWEAIRAVPRGATTTYGTIARQLDSMPRAVGQACGDNPLPLVIPCHRVVSQQGLGGFAHHSSGYLLDVKHWLLRHEGVLLL
ncbi:cysteine methyltransferase [Cupriavidus sp. USMAA2-4]|uniref:Cysteine methyltransferase n=1 Tax=Cupriavidus malaysiensis TaxID=367825 RepID=A0ABN4TM21_9BURK|nr:MULTISPECIES: methylated-DNA--[protein]-cysteine S-methyltransferase [Cupriavidus]AOY94041.1 cysteine methyltransferase [Cupriavidus sp. USMAA2-4]AOZ01141.1 cysteine methyltransferase [Cupriavidus sp. USMAHM13]AOZ07968.1 cysteine methyltransferase [Cupriavidus malaysiensis]